MDLTIRTADRAELEPLRDEPRVLRALQLLDGHPYAMLEGADGDQLLVLDDRALFHLSADLRTLRCAPADPADPSWQRVLLDTVLWTAALLRGFELLHCSAVLTPAGPVAFVAGTGGGKTSLAAEFVRRGHPLFCDDVLALSRDGDRVVAHPGPPLMNLPRALAAGAGELLAEIGDERWVRVDRPHVAPQPLAAVVLVARAPGLELRCRPIEGTVVALIGHSVLFPHMHDRQLARFELFAALASTTPVLELTAGPDAAPSALADALRL